MASIVERHISFNFRAESKDGSSYALPQNVTFFLKKNDSSKVCYTNFFEIDEYNLIEEYIFMTGLSRTCECLSRWLPADERFLLCSFWTDDHVLHFKYCPSSLQKKCQCPDIDMIGGKSDVTTTIFCLSRHLSISSRIPHSPKNATRVQHFMFPESTTSTQSHISNILPL